MEIILTKTILSFYIVCEIVYGRIMLIKILHWEMFYLEQLSSLKILILLNINILAMELDLALVEAVHYMILVGLVTT